VGGDGLVVGRHRAVVLDQDEAGRVGHGGCVEDVIGESEVRERAAKVRISSRCGAVFGNEKVDRCVLHCRSGLLREQTVPVTRGSTGDDLLGRAVIGG
jgi:hypothetical protein